MTRGQSLYHESQFLTGSSNKACLDGNFPPNVNVGDALLAPVDAGQLGHNGLMFVKSWSFTGNRSIPIPNISANPYPIPDWTAPLADQNSVPGQGNGNPRAWFGDHAVIRYPMNGVLTYYDPSYGGQPFFDPNRKIKWEDHALQAFGALFRVARWDGTRWATEGYYAWFERADPKGTLESTIAP